MVFKINERSELIISLYCFLGSTVSQPVVLTLPDNLVKDSPRAYWSVLGKSAKHYNYTGLERREKLYLFLPWFYFVICFRLHF